jgi:hypothetical protein
MNRTPAVFKSLERVEEAERLLVERVAADVGVTEPGVPLPAFKSPSWTVNASF